MAGDDALDLERARAGDEEAFRVLVERHSRSLFGVAYRLTGRQDDAEDVVQETFLKAYRRLHQFEARSDLGSWLYRIAANCAYDVLRARARRDEQPLDPGEGSQAPALALAADDPAPDRLVLSGELRQRMAAAMRRLSALERTAFVLRHHEGLSLEQIGTALGAGTNATKQSLLRAVRKLRQALQPFAGAAS